MEEIISFLALAATIGITGALQPGPLLALIISQSIRYGAKEGAKVAFAPLITDAPIIIVVLFILSKISQSNIIVGIISIFGSFYLAYLAYSNFRIKTVKVSLKNVAPQSLKKGIITNFLNPAVYIFWSTLGAAMISKAMQISPVMPFFYLIVSYGVFVSGNIAIAVMIGKSRDFLQSKWYIWIIRIMGVVLAVFSVMFFIRGIRLLGF